MGDTCAVGHRFAHAVNDGRIVVVVVPYHLVHAVEVAVELYYDVFAGVAARDAYRGHGRFGT